MRAGDKVVFKPPFWNGLPDERTRMVYVVTSTADPFGAHRANQKRISIQGPDGRVRHGVVADRLEAAPASVSEHKPTRSRRPKPEWLTSSYRPNW